MEPLPSMRVDAVKIYAPLGLKGEVTDEVLQQTANFTMGMKRYRDQNWAEAHTIMTLLYESSRELLYRVYLDRIEYFMGNPPDKDWDGVFDFQTK